MSLVIEVVYRKLWGNFKNKIKIEIKIFVNFEKDLEKNKICFSVIKCKDYEEVY